MLFAQSASGLPVLLFVTITVDLVALSCVHNVVKVSYTGWFMDHLQLNLSWLFEGHLLDR